MDSKMIICLVIFALTMISFIWRKIPMAITAIASMVLYTLTGCIDTATALKGFSNTNTILIASMFIVAAGFGKTKYIGEIANLVTKISSGSWKKAFAGYLLITALLAQFIQSPSAVFVIVFPIVLASCEKMNVSPSKVMFPLGLTAIATCSILPIGASAATYAQFNGYFEAFGYTAFQAKVWDIAIARIPSMIFILVYCIFFASKYAPQDPIVPIQSIKTQSTGKERQPLKQWQDIAGLVIFIAVSAALLLASVIRIPNWITALIGALLMIILGILKENEAYHALPASLLLIFIGALATGEALSATGAGELIGNALASVGISIGSNFIFCALFFLVPFVLTQFMNNMGVISIFIPIAIMTAKSLQANPVGLCILSMSVALCAFMTPMGTPTAAMMMGLGGYDVKSMFKQGWFPGICLWLITSLWVSIIFPVL
ncbi:MAG: SLC13 family permease [Candidatus Cloacimonetes bacterium]|nr:SLC13 family permease [Candidatus Cloacimonadota bacterium]